VDDGLKGIKWCEVIRIKIGLDERGGVKIVKLNFHQQNVHEFVV
jgi:hypothetical protein